MRKWWSNCNFFGVNSYQINKQKVFEMNHQESPSRVTWSQMATFLPHLHVVPNQYDFLVYFCVLQKKVQVWNNRRVSILGWTIPLAFISEKNCKISCVLFRWAGDLLRLFFFFFIFVRFSCEKIHCYGWVSCVFLPAVKGGNVSCCVSRTLITPQPTQHTAPICERVYSVTCYISIDVHSF